MFVDVILVHMVEMAVVKIIDVAVMADGGVPAMRAMLMSVVGVVLLGTWNHWRCYFARARLPIDFPAFQTNEPIMELLRKPEMH